MTATPEQVDAWLGVAETQRLEFKEAKRRFGSRKLYEYCVALANERGGKLILGITDKPPRRVVGTTAFRNPLKTEEAILQAVGFRVNIEEVAHPDGRVLVFHIPSRPSGRPCHLKGAYWMRSGSSLVPMTPDQLKSIFVEGQSDWLGEISKNNVSAQDVIEYLDTQTFFELLKMRYPTNRDGVISRLLQERLIDESENGYAIRRIGAILLAKQLSDFSDISYKVPRVVVYTGSSKVDTKLDQSGSKGYAVGFQGLVEFIMGQLPQNEPIEDALRREVKLVPEITIRELVANALIHQDFTLDGMSVMIEIYSDRVEISNPGDTLVPVERFIDGFQSRNERLANLMRRFAICEERGSGIDNVIKMAEVYQLPAPDFRSGFQRTEAILYGAKPFEGMDRAARVRACYQHCVLQHVLRRPMTNQTLRERFQLTARKGAVVSQIISHAVDEGLIKPDRKAGTSRKYAQYLPIWA